MTRKRRRLYIVVCGMLALGGATALVLSAFQDNLVFFYTPSALAAQEIPANRSLRIGGVVEKGSVAKEADGVTTTFRVTDFQKTLAVAYKGILPDLFREGQGVVAQGKIGADGVFRADEVLAKHDENYMPKEVADAIKKSGHWEGAKQ